MPICSNKPDGTRGARRTICANRCAPCRVTHDVCAHLRIREGTKHKCRCSDYECSTVANLQVFTSQEHDIANHYKGGSAHNEDLAPINLGADERQKQCEKGADDVRGNSIQLLFDHCLFGVYGFHDRREEESQALDSDVVEQEDE